MGNAFSNNKSEAVIFFFCSFSIFFLKLAISIKTVEEPWFQDLKGNYMINDPWISIITGILAFSLGFVGVFFLIESEAILVSGLFLLGLILSMFWQLVLLSTRSLAAAIGGLVLIIVYYAFLTYYILRLSRVAGILQFFILIRYIFVFINYMLVYSKNNESL